MTPAEIEALHGHHCRPGFGTTTVDELAYIQRLIQKHRPKRFIEIGTASGLTTGFIARFMAENGGQSVTSIDLAQTFFGARDKPVGYLARQIHDGDTIDISVHAGLGALDLDRLKGGWDMAFIDANHQHPWPTIDTLAVAPHLTGPRIVIHHDLQLYRRFRQFRGIGPRVLFNEMSDQHREADSANGWNIFALDLSLAREVLEQVAIGAFSMPWTVRPPFGRSDMAKMTALLQQHYSARLQGEFADCAKVNRVSLPSLVLWHLRHRMAQTLDDLGLRKP
jgi:hypothetical protein